MGFSSIFLFIFFLFHIIPPLFWIIFRGIGISASISSTQREANIDFSAMSHLFHFPQCQNEMEIWKVFHLFFHILVDRLVCRENSIYLTLPPAQYTSLPVSHTIGQKIYLFNIFLARPFTLHRSRFLIQLLQAIKQRQAENKI